MRQRKKEPVPVRVGEKVGTQQRDRERVRDSVEVKEGA